MRDHPFLSALLQALSRPLLSTVAVSFLTHLISRTPKDLELFVPYLDILAFSDDRSGLHSLSPQPLRVLIEHGMRMDRIREQPTVHSRLTDLLLEKAENSAPTQIAASYLGILAFLNFDRLSVEKLQDIFRLAVANGAVNAVALKTARALRDFLASLLAGPDGETHSVRPLEDGHVV
jgi:hypothetical protein